MILTELFNHPVAYTWSQGGNVAHFEVNGKGYLVDLDPDSNNNQRDSVTVSFALHQPLENRPVGKEWEKYAYDASGTGDELTVFSTVVAIIREFIRTHYSSVSKIIFSSPLNQTSRIKLYDRMVNNLAGEWKLTSQIVSTEKEYTLINPNYKMSDPSS